MTTWSALDLAPILAGDHVEEKPSILARSDGPCLLYRGRLHTISSEPEALKSWVALEASRQLLRDFEQVLFIDFEDSAPSVVQRLKDLGVTAEAILDGFRYMRPDEPLGPETLPDLEAELLTPPALTVIDGITEAFARQGLSPLDNSDVALWLELLPRRIALTGSAVLQLDHVVKDRENRGRWSIGAQHKLAGVDVAYSMRSIEPFARGRDGLVAIDVKKDRPGRIREFAPDSHVALIRAISKDAGAVRIVLDPPGDHHGTGFRPTGFMERISIVLEVDPGLSKRAIREAVGGQTKHVDLALELLAAEEYVDVKRDGSAHLHTSIKPYREAEDPAHRDCVTEPRLDRDQSHPDDHRDCVTPPLRGHVTSHEHDDATNDRDRDYAEAERERIQSKFEAMA